MMTAIFNRNHFFDASAIVKMVVTEPGSRKVMGLLDECGIAYTSWLLLAEALGCLKRKFLEGSLTGEAYGQAVCALLAYVNGGDLEPIDVHVEHGKAVLSTHQLEMSAFHQAFPKLDVADVLQLTIIKDSFLAHYMGDQRTHLITADDTLGKVAVAEGIPVVYVNKD